MCNQAKMPLANDNPDIGSLFNEDGHLNDTGLLLCIDSIVLDKERLVPKPLWDHLFICPICQLELLNYFLFIVDKDYENEITPHPYFGNQAEANSS